jgi:hypothetical protein
MITSKQALKIWGKIVDALANKNITPTHCVLRCVHDGDQLVLEFDPFNECFSLNPPTEVDTEAEVKPKPKKKARK